MAKKSASVSSALSKAKKHTGRKPHQAAPQSQSYSTARDKHETAKPVGYRYTDKLAKRLKVSPSAKPTLEHIKKYSGKGVYFETRKDKSDINPAKKLAKGGATKQGKPQSRSYTPAKDKQLHAKPAGYRFTDKLANKLHESPYEEPTPAQIKKYSGRGVYQERRKDKSDINYTKRFMLGGDTDATMIIDGNAGIYIPKNFSIMYDLKDFGFSEAEASELKKELSSPENEGYWDAWEDVMRDGKTKDGMILQEHDGDLWLTSPELNLEHEYAKGGKLKQTAPQSQSYNPKRDKFEHAKPVGYRYTNKLAKRLHVSVYDTPTQAHIEKYKGKGVYWENRKDKSDMNFAKMFEHGGMEEYAKGGSPRIANQNARKYTENMLDFTGNNLEGKTLANGNYVVLSYGWYPLWYYNKRDGLWYMNKDKYSVYTSKQTSQSRPTYNAVSLTKSEMQDYLAKGTMGIEFNDVNIIKP